MLLAGFHWKINSKAGCGISDHATSWISLWYKFQGWTWNFWYCCWLDFTRKEILWLDMEFLVMLLAGFHWDKNSSQGYMWNCWQYVCSDMTGNNFHGWTHKLFPRLIHCQKFHMHQLQWKLFPSYIQPVECQRISCPEMKIVLSHIQLVACQWIPCWAIHKLFHSHIQPIYCQQFHVQQHKTIIWDRFFYFQSIS